MSAYTIRTIVPANDRRVRNAIERIHREAFPTYEMIRLDLPTTHWWIAEQDGRYVAFAALWPSIRSPFTGYLARAAVTAAHRGKGLQRRLIQVRERKAKALGWAAMITDCLPDNLHSANNFIACGYRLYKPEVSWAAYENPLYWRKFLDKEVP